MIVTVRGIYCGMESSRRLEDVVKNIVEESLSKGERITMTSRTVMKLARSGRYLLPPDLDTTNMMALGGYCGTILYRLHPNGGSVKVERNGPCLTYEFVPTGGDH